MISGFTGTAPQQSLQSPGLRFVTLSIHITSPHLERSGLKLLSSQQSLRPFQQLLSLSNISSMLAGCLLGVCMQLLLQLRCQRSSPRVQLAGMLNKQLLDVCLVLLLQSLCVGLQQTLQTHSSQPCCKGKVSRLNQSCQGNQDQRQNCERRSGVAICLMADVCSVLSRLTCEIFCLEHLCSQTLWSSVSHVCSMCHNGHARIYIRLIQ